MALIGRVFLMALCVLTAYALPSLNNGFKIGNEHFKLRAVTSPTQKAATAVVTPQAVNKSSTDTCTIKYSTAMSNINNQTVNKTKDCYKSAEVAFKEFDSQVLNATVKEVTAISKNLQMRLSNCSTNKTNLDILVCVIDSFNENMANLNNMTSKAQVVASSVNEYEYSVEIATKMCVNEVMISSKVNSSIADNDMQKCLSNNTVGGLYGSKSGLKFKTLQLN
ncbi:uncharacterized protein LOC129906802 [Episyrphus balteatus]|uniref:uncharacterized protein LOC129906802 n=1 Tax=Episyrphus balteatus TaxID=286459 RepID=UPI002486C087|nr:uncharacterized protein LOC129906802 [Episyrphus balteatus]